VRFLPLFPILACTACVTTQANSPAVLEKRVWDWPDLYYASEAASGRNLCAGELYQRRQADFYRTYGKRIRAVLDRHIARFGRQQTISVQPCLLLQGETEERHHAAAMTRFVVWLEQAERDLELR
jgi:hypothetical protein